MAGEDPEGTFMRNWAKCLLENCLVRYRAECRALGKDARYKAFEARYLGPEGRFASYGEIAEALGMSEWEVGKHLERARKRVARLIRDEIGNAVSGPDQVDGEIDDLVRWLA
jgi:hypothetical protein